MTMSDYQTKCIDWLSYNTAIREEDNEKNSSSHSKIKETNFIWTTNNVSSTDSFSSKNSNTSIKSHHKIWVESIKKELNMKICRMRLEGVPNKKLLFQFMLDFEKQRFILFKSVPPQGRTQLLTAEEAAVLVDRNTFESNIKALYHMLMADAELNSLPHQKLRRDFDKNIFELFAKLFVDIQNDTESRGALAQISNISRGASVSGSNAGSG